MSIQPCHPQLRLLLSNGTSNPHRKTARRMHRLDAVANLIGPANVLTAPEDIDPYAIDWRRNYRGTPIAVLKPGTTRHVAQAVQHCAEAGLAIVPAGGRTGLCGGA